jgi:hypothetical protein
MDDWTAKLLVGTEGASNPFFSPDGQWLVFLSYDKTVTGHPEGKDVVWVPTSQALVEKMLDLAKVTAQDYVIDLGSGGRADGHRGRQARRARPWHRIQS